MRRCYWLGIIVVLATLTDIILCGDDSFYSGYKVLSVAVKTPDEAKLVSSLGRDVEVLSSHSHVRGYIDILVSPKALSSIHSTLSLSHLRYTIAIEDVGGLIQEQETSEHRLRVGGDVPDFHSSYHSYEEICGRLDALAEEFPDKVEVFELEEVTFEERKIKAVRITADIAEDASSSSRPLVWLDGGIHAREWASPATLMFMLDAILGKEGQDTTQYKDMVEVLKTHQIVIAPVINPDGYEYSRESAKTRLWRKTRTPGGCKDLETAWYGGCFYQYCYGSDPNRNWDVEFGTEGVEADPCSIVYPGKEPWDQPSVNVVRQYLESVRDKLSLYVSYHSYSQMFLHPVCYTEEPSAHDAHHRKVGELTTQAIKGVHGAEYVVLQGSDLYPVSGSSMDWVYDKLGIVDSYAFELRDEGKYGFLLPAEQIRPSGEENMAGLLVMIENIFKED